VIEIDMRPVTRDRPRLRDNEMVIEKPIDKRSNMIDRKVAPRQALCYVCCAEFGVNSLAIHMKTCLKKHDWGLNSISNDETMSKKQAAKNRRMCAIPGDPPSAPIPAAKSKLETFEEYNQQAQELFFEHANNCLWCRTQNVEAMEAMRRAEEDARRKAEEDEAARRARELEDERRRRQAAEDEAARRKALEDEEARWLAEEARRKKLLEDEARKRARDEVGKWLGDAEDARRRAAEEEENARRKALEDAEAARMKALADAEEARRLAEEIAEAEERRKRLMAQGKHTFLKRGEGVQAASESGNVQAAKELEAKAKHDIAYYSLSHAKKTGLVNDTVQTSKASDVTFKEVEVDEVAWKKQWSPEEEAKFSKSAASGMMSEEKTEETKN
jgi:hypothetical protein